MWTTTKANKAMNKEEFMTMHGGNVDAIYCKSQETDAVQPLSDTQIKAEQA